MWFGVCYVGGLEPSDFCLVELHCMTDDTDFEDTGGIIYSYLRVDILFQPWSLREDVDVGACP